ncbi:dethiobiotin synthetase [Mesorhizobium jarvisii]
MTARAIIIGAPRSGSGKTSVTIGILRALTRRGLKVRGAKSGPDYIDPGFHTAATGLSGVNLDSWAMPPSLLNALAAQQADDTDFVILESAMGLFDGIPAAPGRTGSAADLARLYGLPVLLVLDVSGQSTTAAAVAKGFATYDPDVRMAGVVLNRLGSERHRKLSGDAIEAIGLPVVGAILRDPTLNLPERHLGLVQAGEYDDLMAHLDRLADMAEKSLDLDAVMRLATPLAPAAGGFADALQPPGQRIALAEDAAFTFLYPHVAAYWRKGRRGDRSVLAARRRGARRQLRRLLVARRLPRASRRQACRCCEFPCRNGAFRRDQAHPWRVRRLHGAWGSAGGCLRRDARNAWPARPCHQLRQEKDESRLSRGAVARRLPAGRARRADPRP